VPELLALFEVPEVFDEPLECVTPNVDGGSSNLPWQRCRQKRLSQPAGG